MLITSCGARTARQYCRLFSRRRGPRLRLGLVHQFAVEKSTKLVLLVMEYIDYWYFPLFDEISFIVCLRFDHKNDV